MPENFPAARRTGYETIYKYAFDEPVRVRNREGVEFEAERVHVSDQDGTVQVWGFPGPVGRGGLLGEESADGILTVLDAQGLLPPVEP